MASKAPFAGRSTGHRHLRCPVRQATGTARCAPAGLGAPQVLFKARSEDCWQTRHPSLSDSGLHRKQRGLAPRQSACTIKVAVEMSASPPARLDTRSMT